MPEIKRREEHEVPQPKDEDVVVKTGKWRFYFQNYYSIISLLNDLFLGALYVLGALINVLDGPALYSNICYLVGALFLLMRPIIKIIRNIYVYDKDEYKKEVLKKGQKNEDHQEKHENNEQQQDEAHDENDKADDTIEVEKEEEKDFKVEKEKDKK